MRILVPFKRVSDPDNANKVKVSEGGKNLVTDGLEWKANPFDEYAVEAALRLAENAATNEKLGEVVVATLGPAEATQTMRQALAMGADRGILVSAEDHALDAGLVAKALKAIVEKEKPDWVIMGKQAVDGDSNAAGQMLAELLGWPCVSFAMSIQQNADKSLTIGREVDTGVLTVKVTGPAVVTVDLRIIHPKGVINGVTPETHTYQEGARYASLKGIMAAKKKPIEEQNLESLGVRDQATSETVGYQLPAGRSGSAVFVQTADELVQKLRQEKKVLS